MYSLENKQWHVFNESATRGYICLLNSPGHFDVLNGVGGPPVIPASAHTHAIGRHNLETSNDAWQCLQRGYRLEFVHTFPQQFAGIHILNNPVVLHDTAREKATVSGEKLGREQKVNVLKCDYPGCSYVGRNLQSLRMHIIRCHKKNTKSNETMSVKSDTASVNTARSEKCATEQTLAVHKCDYHGCSYVSKNMHSLSMHKMKSHNIKRKCAGTLSLESDSATVDTVSCKESVAKQKVTVHKCDYRGCNYIGKAVKSVAMHKRRCHKKSVVSSCTDAEINRELSDVEPDDTPVASLETIGSTTNELAASQYDVCGSIDEKGKDFGTQKTSTFSCAAWQRKVIHRCDFPGCNYATKKVQSLTMHKVRVHSAKTSLRYAHPADKETVSKYSSTEADYNVHSADSVEIAISQKRKRADDNRESTNVESFHVPPVSKNGPYVCDVDSCGSIHDTAKGLSIHKRKRHSSTPRIDDITIFGVVQGNDVSSMKSDSLSVTTIVTTDSSVRSSLRIRNQKKAFKKAPDVETIGVRPVSNTGPYVCNVDGCSSAHDTTRGLSIHKRKRHSLAVHKDDPLTTSMAQAEDVSSLKSDSLSDSTVYSSVRRSVRIQNKKQRIDVPESESNVRQTEICTNAVSYTHLTLPTNREV